MTVVADSPIGTRLASLIIEAFADNDFVDVTPFTIDLQGMNDTECQRLLKRVLVHARKTNTVSMSQRALSVQDCTNNRDLLLCILLCLHHTHTL